MANPRKREKWLLLVGVLLSFAFVNPVNGLCDPVKDASTGDEALPDYYNYFLKDFSITMEMTEIFYNRTNHVRHSYFQFDDHGYWEQTHAVMVDNSGDFAVYHYYPNISRYIEEYNTECKEYESPEDPVYTPPGWFDDDPTHGSKMYGPATILRKTHFLKAKYEGADHLVNGIKCEKWYICDNGEIEINLFFSQRDAFDMPEKDFFPDELTANRIPVMFEYYPSEESLHVTYTVIEFKPWLPYRSDAHIETPRGISCEGKISINPTKTLPTIPSHYYHAVEVVANSFIDDMDFRKEQVLDKFEITYSEDMSVVRWDATPPMSESEVDQLPDKIIHDFNTGVQYAISRVYGKCYRDFIPDYTLDKKHPDGVGGYGVMVGPNEFFHLDKSYAFVGERGSRDLYGNLFTSTRSDIPDPKFALEANYPKAVLEYYFPQGREYSPIPVSLPLRGDLFLYNASIEDINLIYDRMTMNYYSAKEMTVSTTEEFSVTECFDKYSDDWSTLYLFFPATKIQFAAVAANEYDFRQKVYFYLLQCGDISPTRIGGVEVSDGTSGVYTNTTDSDVIIAQVKLMERAPYLYGYRKPDEPIQIPGDDEKEMDAFELETCATYCSQEELFKCKSFHLCTNTGKCYLSPTEGAEGPQTKNYTCLHYIDNHENQTFDDLPTSAVDVHLREYIQKGKFTFNIHYVNVDVNLTATQHLLLKTPDPLDPIKKQFTTFKKFYTISDPETRFTLKDKSSAACMSACVLWMEFKCETIVHNFLTGECLLFSQHAADIDASRMVSKADCYIHARSYITDYEGMLGGISINTTGPVMPGYSPEECARKCTNSKDYNCNSFEFCWEKGTCHLHVETFIDVSDGGNYSMHQPCMHFEKKAERIFTRYKNSGLPNKDHKLVAQLTSVSQCAKLCLEDTSETCQSYDFCVFCGDEDYDVCGEDHKGGFNMCFLGDHHIGEPGLTLSKAYSCDHYSRDLFGDQDYASWIASQRKNDKPYTDGSMAGLAFGMIFLGIILVMGFLYAMAKVKPGTLPNDISLKVIETRPLASHQTSVTFENLSSKDGESDI